MSIIWSTHSSSYMWFRFGTLFHSFAFLFCRRVGVQIKFIITRILEIPAVKVLFEKKTLRQLQRHYEFSYLHSALKFNFEKKKEEKKLPFTSINSSDGEKINKQSSPSSKKEFDFIVYFTITSIAEDII